MSREKQIEEMAIELSKINCKPSGCGYCYLEYGTLEDSCEEYLVYKKMAQSLYNAGYRKQSENVIELPCKVGTTLYFIYNSPYADKPDLTPRIYKTADWYFEVDKTGIVINTSYIHSFNKEYDYHLGKTVFFTQEEAEKTLAERSNK